MPNMSLLTSQHGTVHAHEVAKQTNPSDPDATSNSGTFDYAANSAFQRSIYKECEPYLPDLKGLKKITIVDYVRKPVFVRVILRIRNVS